MVASLGNPHQDSSGVSGDPFLLSDVSEYSGHTPCTFGMDIYFMNLLTYWNMVGTPLARKFCMKRKLFRFLFW